jgi:GGDEF domain-containing protein
MTVHRCRLEPRNSVLAEEERIFSRAAAFSCDLAAALFSTSASQPNDNMLRERQTAQPVEGEGPAPRLSFDEVDALGFPGDAGRGPQSMATRVERMLAQCRRQRGVMALVCVSVERIGASAGELPPAMRRQVCQDLALRMRTRVRGCDLVVHEGDGDAGVLMAGAGADTAQRVAQRFAQALSGAYRVGGQLVEVTVRVGRAAYPDDGTQGAELLLKARERMDALSDENTSSV